MALSDLNNDTYGDSGSLSELNQRASRGKRPIGGGSSGLTNDPGQALRDSEREKGPKTMAGNAEQRQVEMERAARGR